MVTTPNCIKLWQLYGIAVEELDFDLFIVLFEESFAPKSLKMLADICSCMPVFVFSSLNKD